YYVKKFRENDALRNAEIAGLKNADDAKNFIAKVRARIAGAYDFPAERCDLNPRITGTVEREDFIVEKVIYDSRPDFPVCANLYIPKKRTGKVPGVIFLCGHAQEGRFSETYQAVMISLCRKGCVVLAIDPIGQGERRQYPDDDIYCCSEHNLFNRRMLLSGDNMGAWRVYDAVRGLDYLLSREEVDPERVGVTGNSGGGTLTTLVAGVDDRFKAAAPSCYITRWLRNVENELPVDAEQIPPGTGADGGEMADFLIAQAPRPLLILGQKNDFFDIRGTREVYEEVKKIYALLGKEDNVRLFIGPTSHGFSIHNREAAYGFFNEVFALGSDEKEPENQYFTEEELAAAPGRLSINIPGSRTVNDYIRKRTLETIAGRPQLTPDQLRVELKKLLGIGDIPVPSYRQLRGKYFADAKRGFSRFGIETEEYLVCTLSLMGEGCVYHIPAADRAELYIPNINAQEELLRRSVPTDYKLYGFDYRGVGESRPDGCDQGSREFFAYYTYDYHYASLALLRNESMLGRRVYDVLCAIKLLRAYGTGDIRLTASGIGEIPALLAAFLSEE
ncbi:MAG: acetylxylan esterase, partial [Lentisphaeria bacterium]|nr:acetylxylan esterase [Lentisphaeria bacterium]